MNSSSFVKKQIAASIRRVTPLYIFIGLLIVFSLVGVVKTFKKTTDWRTVKIQVVGKDWTNTFTQYDGYRSPYWLTDKIKSGDIERSYTGEETARVLRTEIYERGGMDFDVYITVKLKVEYNTRMQSYSYRGQPILAGSPIKLKLNRALVIGQIIDDQVPPDGYESKQVTITGRIRNAEPWFIEKLIPENTISNGNQTVAKILSVQTDNPVSQILTTTQTGTRTNVILEKNPRTRDVILTVQLTIERYSNGWFYGGHQRVKAGDRLYLYFPNVDAREIEIQNVE